MVYAMKTTRRTSKPASKDDHRSALERSASTEMNGLWYRLGVAKDQSGYVRAEYLEKLRADVAVSFPVVSARVHDAFLAQLNDALEA